jgi:hypothetical protein
LDAGGAARYLARKFQGSVFAAHNRGKEEGNVALLKPTAKNGSVFGFTVFQNFQGAANNNSTGSNNSDFFEMAPHAAGRIVLDHDRLAPP